MVLLQRNSLIHSFNKPFIKYLLHTRHEDTKILRAIGALEELMVSGEDR